MRILQTPVRYHPHIGGVESYVHDLSKKLVEFGHDVTVVCAQVESDTGQRETIDGIDVLRLDSIGTVGNTNVTPTLPKVLYQQVKDADIVHTHIPTPWSADLSALAGVMTDTPVVVTYHNDIVGDGIVDYVASVYNTTVLKLTLKLANRILVTQPDYCEESDHLEPYLEKTEVVHNGVDVDHFEPVDVDDSEQRQMGIDPDRDSLFFLSVLDEHHDYKGLDVLLRAMDRLSESMNQCPQLLVGGSGPSRCKYEQLAEDLGVTEHVDFLGYVEEGDLRQYYSSSDAFVLPSKSSEQEGFGLVLLEALACKTPVVTTDVVGIADEVADNRIGRVVDSNAPETLAEAIRTQLSSSVDTDTMRSLCEEQYSWRSSAETMVNVYESLVYEPKVAPQ